MCTAIKLNNLFGRTLDNVQNYFMNIVITPSEYEFIFKYTVINDKRYSIIGMSYVANNYPLYAEAVNEKGLAIASLEFEENAHYFNIKNDKVNICVHEFIPYILRQCENIIEVKSLLINANIVNDSFDKNLHTAALHWLISDKTESIVVESTKKGIFIYDNPYNVLTNNPQFDYHKININNYLNLTSKYPDNRMSSNLHLNPFSFSFGSIGLPGDYSSPSRFIKALFLINNTTDVSEDENVIHFFHILDSISPPKGIALNKDNQSQFTIYSSCIDQENIIYYYKTYWDNEIKAIKLNACNCKRNNLMVFNVDYQRKYINNLN